MIRRLSGTIISFDEKTAVLDVAGVGYEIHMTTPDLSTLCDGEKATVHTHLTIKDDAHELYGFLDIADLLFYEKLITVSGVGPKTGLSILNSAPREIISNAIADKDVSPLTRVSGIGKKIAERVVLELHGKVEKMSSKNNKDDLDVLEGLRALGFREKDAREALKKTTAVGTGERIKEALKILQNNE